MLQIRIHRSHLWVIFLIKRNLWNYEKYLEMLGSYHSEIAIAIQVDNSKFLVVLGEHDQIFQTLFRHSNCV